MQNPIARVVLYNWRQFQHVDLKLDSQVTLIAGANSSGKTTLLRLLSQLLGWNQEFGSVHARDQWGNRILVPDGKWAEDKSVGNHPNSRYRQIGSVSRNDLQAEYSSTALSITYSTNKATYEVPLKSGRLSGFFFPSHRPPFGRVDLETVNIDPPNLAEMLRQHIANYQAFLSGERYYKSGKDLQHIHPVNYTLKSSLMQLALFGFGSDLVKPDKTMVYVFDAFQDTLRRFLPPEVGFQRFRIDMPDITLVCKNHEFSLDSVSGGMASLLDLVWQMFLSAFGSKESLVLIDEPENHLHPELQRILLPRLQETFKDTQFIVATHSPVVVGSVELADIYALVHNSEGYVVSRHCKKVESPASAEAVLQEILGMRVLEPEWVVDSIEDIVKRFETQPLTKERLAALRKELSLRGHEDSFPQVVNRLTNQKKN